MDNLIGFMMVLIALAMLSFLNSGHSEKKQAKTMRGLVLSPEKKLPV